VPPADARHCGTVKALDALADRVYLPSTALRLPESGHQVLMRNWSMGQEWTCAAADKHSEMYRDKAAAGDEA
jgi:hypothetical protein